MKQCSCAKWNDLRHTNSTSDKWVAENTKYCPFCGNKLGNKTASELYKEYHNVIQVLQSMFDDCGNKWFEIVPQVDNDKILVKTNFGVFSWENANECKAWTSGLHFAVWNKIKFKKGRGNT